MKAGCAFGFPVLGLGTEVVTGSHVLSRKEMLLVPSPLSFDVWSPSETSEVAVSTMSYPSTALLRTRLGFWMISEVIVPAFVVLVRS